jgi:coenzyme F420-dependent glucose-6-phosphate dehydrogenase
LAVDKVRSLEIAVDLGENEKNPAQFRDLVVLSEKLGFDAAWLGDHFMPWVHSGNRSSFVWSLLGSALEASNTIKTGPYVTSPIGGRYHPLVVAQAAATLDSMYPGRFLLGVGTGEAMNEEPFMESWPAWKERMDRMVEGLDLIRRFWESKSYFDYDGRYFRAKQIFLYTKPSRKIDIFFSAIGPKAAHLAGEHGDGLISLGSRNSLEQFRNVIIPSFYEGARKAGKDPDKMKKIVSLGFTFDDEQTLLRNKNRGAAGNLAKGALDEPDPRRIEAMGERLTDEQILKATHFCSSWSDVVELIEKHREAGFSQIVLETGPDEDKLRLLSEKLLPSLRSS